jgi:hypothetical protein
MPSARWEMRLKPEPADGPDMMPATPFAGCYGPKQYCSCGSTSAGERTIHGVAFAPRATRYRGSVFLMGKEAGTLTFY